MPGKSEHQLGNDYKLFLQDVADAMKKHNIEHAVIICQCNAQLRNSYVALGPTDPLYEQISDAFNAWLSQSKDN